MTSASDDAGWVRPRAVAGLQTALADQRRLPAGQGRLRRGAAVRAHGPGLRNGAGGLTLGGTDGLRPAGRWWTDTLDPYTGRRHFTAEYPWADAGPAGLTERLDRALEPLLAAAEPPGEDCYSRWARRLEPLVAATREKTAADPARDPPTALGHLAGGGHAGLAAAVVVVRELAGRERTSLEDAVATVLVRADAMHYWGRYPDACALALDLLR